MPPPSNVNDNIRSPLRFFILFLGVLVPILISSYQNKVPFDLSSLDRFNLLSKSTPGVVHSTPNATFSFEHLRKKDGSWDTVHPHYRLLDALRAYARFEDERVAEVATWRTRYRRLPDNQKPIIDRTLGYMKRLTDAEQLMKKNALVARAILEHGLQWYEIDEAEFYAFMNATEASGTTHFHCQDAMKYFIRDWSSEGLIEREPTMPCILSAVEKAFPKDSRFRDSPPKMLVPGAGLGRLGHEIANLRGFDVTINEWSYHMLLAYHWLQTLEKPNSISFHPFVDSWSHRTTVASLIREVQFPDNVDLLSQSSVNMVDGDFTKVFDSEQGTFDAVVTLFFLDTARNLLTYLWTIHSMLKPGGVWINHGPLLYRETLALKLTLEEVILLAEAVGFRFEQPGDQCGQEMEGQPLLRGELVPYQSDAERLSRNAYLSQHWVARKL